MALKSSDHLLWHPFAKIPAAEIAGAKFYETSAICRYIDLLFEEASLVPQEPLAAARMEQWISSINCYYHRPCISNLVGHYVFPRGSQGKPDKSIIQGAMPEVQAALRQLSYVYAQNDYLAGQHLSLADLFIAPIIRQMQQTPEGQECLACFPVIEEKLCKVFGRPSFQHAHQLFRSYLPKGHCLVDDAAC